MPARPPPPRRGPEPRVSIARALSKLGHCSRSQGVELVRQGRVRVNGATTRDPDSRVDPARDCIEVDGTRVAARAHQYLVLHKPRGLVTTTSDERGRDTVMRCLPEEQRHLSPVGRLDMASEGLLLFTNDTRWAARILDPASHLDKLYHVQVDRVASPELLDALVHGVEESGEPLRAVRAGLLRSGGRNSWLEVVLDQGRNRQIRRMLGALGVEVLRLIRVAIGPVRLGDLARGAYRPLDPAEKDALDRALGWSDRPPGS